MMTGTKGKSGGKRDGAGRPTLIEQFNAAIESGDDDKALKLMVKIEQRQKDLLAELEFIRQWENSREYNHICWEMNRRNAAQANIA
jgi:hypothetical protein